MNSIYYLIYAVMLLAGFAIYFWFARKFKIVDVPNHRTMHEEATIRGGGLVPFVMIAGAALIVGNPGVYFLIGFVLIGITGFLDDLINLPGIIRFSIQIIAVVLILQELELLSLGFAVLLISVIVAAGTLNAFNFMDGLNGMTAGYSTVLIVTLIYLNYGDYHFIDMQFLFLVLIAMVIFSYYNFRKNAVCFAGDVGSLSVAYIVVYLMVKLISETHQYIFILFLTIYGVDTIFTIVHRLYLRQNIFEAHRLHLFQVAVSNKGFSHLQMSGMYMILQMFINIIIIIIAGLSVTEQLWYSVIMLTGLSLAYVVIKRKIMSLSS